VKNVLVTGASGGIGSAIALALAEPGWTLALHYRSDLSAVSRLAEAVNGAGARAYIVQADLATPGGASSLGAAVRTDVGPVDILVNNAGDWVEKPLLETNDQEWDRMINTDLRSTYELTRSLAPSMVERNWGRIVNISSIASLNYVPGEGLYGIAKAGINMLTKTLGVELARSGVTANAVAPGWTLPAFEDFPLAADYPQCQDAPDGRPGHAREVASLVRYLVSEDAGHITGQIFPIDGGLSVTMAKGR
jgi:NAD(P)-dependent dehydrogenase (short-subunit alcohol dehydrogenase family)